MKQGLKAQGFSMVEVLIVLAVSGALLLTGLNTISGQQNKVGFIQAINEIKSQVDTVINNVATGYYAVNSDFPCAQSATGPDFSGTSSSEGTHYGCILVGRAIQFGESGSNGTKYNIFNLVGLQYQYVSSVVTSNDVNTLIQANPKAIPNIIENKTLDNGLKATNVRYNGSKDLSTVAFITDFAEASSTGLTPSSRSAQLWAVDTSFGSTQAVGKSDLDMNASNKYLGPANKVHICFQSGGTSQVGVLIIGGSGRQLTTSLKIYNNKTDANNADSGDCL